MGTQGEGGKTMKVDRLMHLVGFDPEIEVKEDLAKKIRCELLSRKLSPRSLSNGVHLDISKLVQSSKLSRQDGASIQIILAQGRYETWVNLG